MSSKIFQLGAYAPEAGLKASPPSAGWGGGDFVEPGAGGAFPWISFDNEYTVKTEQDNSVVGRAFGSPPRLVGYEATNKLSFYARFWGLDYFNYWMFGFENKVKPTFLFKSAAGFSDPPVKGYIFTNNSQEFTWVKEVVGKNVAGEAESIYVFRGEDAPTASGTLTKPKEYFLVFSRELVASNSIALTMDGESLGAVVFNTSHLQTMNDLIDAMEAKVEYDILDIDLINGNMVVHFTSGEDWTTITCVVTGGVTQPVVTPGTTPEITMAFESASGQMYEHLYEIDSIDRKFRAYSVAEAAQVDGWDTDDRKNLACTLGKRMGSYDFLYPNCMCKTWKYNCKAGSMASWEVDFLAFEQKRDDYNSDTWTFAYEDLYDNANVPAHYQHTLLIGTEIADLANTCAADISISCEAPVQEIQTNCSGLHIAEPLLSGVYNMTFSANIPRHDAQTYQVYRDNQTHLCAVLNANYGWNVMQLLVKRMSMTKAGPDDSDVAAEPLEGKIHICPQGEDPFLDWSDWVEVHESPILMYLINDNPNNSMRLI